MHRPGTNPDDVQPQDILCDFCGEAAWANEQPCVEGHHGSVICGACLTAAYASLVLESDSPVDSGAKCTLCLEHRDEPSWNGDGDAVLCRRCVKQAAGALHKSKDWEWTKPEPR